MPKCTPGDLAIIVYAYNTVNIGTIVKVLAVHPNQLEIESNQQDVLWTCRAAHPLTYSVNNKRRKRSIGPVPDSYMRPIRGGPLGQDIALGVVLWQIRKEQEEALDLIERESVYV